MVIQDVINAVVQENVKIVVVQGKNDTRWRRFAVPVAQQTRASENFAFS